MVKESSVKIGLKAFLFSAGIILLLMIGSGILTVVLPSGSYERIVEDGRTLAVNGSYREIPKPAYPVWRWFTAPLEVLTGPESLTPIMLVLFILIVGGSMAILESAGVMETLVKLLVARFAAHKYRLIALVILFFMLISSFVAIYEEMIPVVIFIIPVAISLGFDTMTGLGMSLLALSFGFSAAVTNPFTIAVAQRIAGLPLFSGAWLRLVFFAAVYGLVVWYVIRYAKKVEANPKLSPCYAEDEAVRQSLGNGLSAETTDALSAKKVWKALLWFCGCIALALVFTVAAARSPLSDLAFPVMALLFLAGGLGGGLFAGLGLRIAAAFGRGLVNFIPGIVLVLMAYSVKHIISAGMIMDTILYGAATLIRQSPPMAAAFLIYAVTLVMNFFIGSASAKAFLMMPLLTPLADLTGVTRQTAVLAFNFGDGFSNMIFPTSALLLIGLSFSSAGYTKWMAWTWKLQLAILALTSAFLAFAVAIGFGPF